MRRSHRKTYGLLRRTEGASAVEFGIILPAFLLIVCGIMDFGNLYYQTHLVNEAAREGARRISVSQNLASSATEVTTFIKTHYNNNFDVDVDPTTPVAGGDVTVTVTDAVQLITPVISNMLANPFTVKGVTVMRVEN